MELLKRLDKKIVQSMEKEAQEVRELKEEL